MDESALLDWNIYASDIQELIRHPGHSCSNPSVRGCANIQRTLHDSSEMWILSSRGNNNISLVWQPHLWNELFLPLEDVSSTTSLYVYLPCWIFWKFTVTKLSLSRRLCSWKNPRVCMSSWTAIPIVSQPDPMDNSCSMLDGSRPTFEKHLRIKSKDQYRGCDSVEEWWAPFSLRYRDNFVCSFFSHSLRNLTLVHQLEERRSQDKINWNKKETGGEEGKKWRR